MGQLQHMTEAVIGTAGQFLGFRGGFVKVLEKPPCPDPFHRGSLGNLQQRCFGVQMHFTETGVVEPPEGKTMPESRLLGTWVFRLKRSCCRPSTNTVGWRNENRSASSPPSWLTGRRLELA